MPGRTRFSGTRSSGSVSAHRVLGDDAREIASRVGPPTSESRCQRSERRGLDLLFVDAAALGIDLGPGRVATTVPSPVTTTAVAPGSSSRNRPSERYAHRSIIGAAPRRRSPGRGCPADRFHDRTGDARAAGRSGCRRRHSLSAMTRSSSASSATGSAGTRREELADQRADRGLGHDDGSFRLERPASATATGADSGSASAARGWTRVPRNRRPRATRECLGLRRSGSTGPGRPAPSLRPPPPPPAAGRGGSDAGSACQPKRCKKAGWLIRPTKRTTMSAAIPPTPPNPVSHRPGWPAAGGSTPGSRSSPAQRPCRAYTS